MTLRLVHSRPVSRQSQWEKAQARNFNNKRCVVCGRRLTILKRYCVKCADIRNRARRKRYKKRKGQLRKAGVLK